uniref:Uncharacterized protein n=1 Tax=Trypanosoma congolense (strain IL3000) TaxID=1068625 RepID=G0UN29_TRYCI|nr:hypothetical protein, unlikely [Trypanosoma congolense IL3000]
MQRFDERKYVKLWIGRRRTVVIRPTASDLLMSLFHGLIFFLFFSVFSLYIQRLFLSERKLCFGEGTWCHTTAPFARARIMNHSKYACTCCVFVCEYPELVGPRVRVGLGTNNNPPSTRRREGLMDKVQSLRVMAIKRVRRLGKGDGRG